MGRKRNAYCLQCGEPLGLKNSIEAPIGWCKNTGCVYFCVDCQQKYFDEMLAQKVSPKLATYCCCATFNIPFHPNLAAGKKITGAWKSYLERINIADGNTGFLSGATDVRRTIGEGEILAGTDLQRRTWGLGPEKHPYTDGEFDELDAFYAAYTEQLERGGGPDAQQEHTIRLCARCNIEVNRALAAGKPEVVQRYSKIIQENLAAENLRKKDTKPLDDLRVDSLVDALERKGYLKDGKILGYEELLDKLRGDVPHYRYTRDAADQMLLAIMNTMRANEGMSEYTDLPIAYRITDDKGEFAEKPNAREIRNYNQLGLLREGTRPNTMLKNKPARVKRQKTTLMPKGAATEDFPTSPTPEPRDVTDKEGE